MKLASIEALAIENMTTALNLYLTGELDWLRSRGVEVIELDDERCKRLMTEFQARHPRVWAEDIGQA